MANETGAGDFVDSYLGKHETYGTREQFEKGEGIEPYAFDTDQYYDAERGGFVQPKGSMTPQYTNPFWETVGEGGLDPILDFFMIPKGWRGKVDPSTGDAYRTTGMDKVLVGQNINPAGLLTGAGAKGLVSAASTKLPPLLAMAPIWWQGGAKFSGLPKLEYIGTGQGALSFGWGQYFSDRRSIAGGYTKAEEFLSPPHVQSATLTTTTGEVIPALPDPPVPLTQVYDELTDHYRNLSGKVREVLRGMTRNLTGRPGLPSDKWHGKLIQPTVPPAAFADHPRYVQLKGFMDEVGLKQNAVGYMVMYGKDWAKNLRRIYSGKGVDKLGASPDRIYTTKEIDEFIKKGDEIWKDVTRSPAGATYKYDISDDLVGKRGEKLLDWNVQFKDHPKEIQDKIIAALEALSGPTLLTGEALQKSLLRLRLDDALKTIHGGGTRFKTATGEKYLPKPLTEEMIRRDALDLMTGEDIYNLIRTDIPIGDISKGTWIGINEARKQASLWLGKFGLDGLRYQSGTLSGVKAVRKWDADVTRNYVIWSQDILDQMKRIGAF